MDCKKTEKELLEEGILNKLLSEPKFLDELLDELRQAQENGENITNKDGLTNN